LTHSGHTTTGEEALSLMGYEDKPFSSRYKRAERLPGMFAGPPPA
jgi:hypothetical protein